MVRKYRRVKVWSAVVIAASLAAGAAVWMAPANAANVNQWRIAWKSTGNFMNAVAAPGPNEAWAVSESSCPASPCVLHWNGRAWSHVSIPGASGFEADWVGASSATNVMVFGFRNGQNGAFRYDGSWHWVSAPSDISPLDGNRMLLVGAGNAWAINNGGSVDRWINGTWRTATVPADLTSIDGSVKKGLWAVGSYRDFVHGLLTIYHLVGSTWTPVTMPHPQTYAVTPAIGVESATSVWVAAAPPGTQINGTGGRIYLLHWNGSTWKQVTSPLSFKGQTPRPVPDGHGGAWLGFEHWTGSSWVNTLTTAPKGLETTQEVKVAGTSGSYWAAGILFGTSGSPVIAVYGPTP